MSQLKCGKKDYHGYAKYSEKIAQLGWFYGSSLTTAITGRTFVLPLKTTVRLKNHRFLFPRTQVIYRCFRAMSNIDRDFSFPSRGVSGKKHKDLVLSKAIQNNRSIWKQLDVWIDFVNLRSEDYAGNSRIPTMEFGSAEQDAYRRDLTINSLFYNINTCSVEDFTGRGLDDLKSGTIVTPSPPKETFLDDPLRVLRAIRFSSRFEFEMVVELKLAAADNDVKSTISDKISRERIGHEIDLMVSGNQPVKAITILSNLGLFWVVFTLPPNFAPQISEHDRICVNYMNAAWKLMHAIEGCNLSDEQRRLYSYASLFLPLRKTIYGDIKKKSISAVNHIFKYSLKLKTSDADNVTRLHNAADKFLSLIPFMISSEVMKPLEVDWKPHIIDVPVSLKLRILLGLLLRDIKDYWRAALMLSILLHKDSGVEGIVDKIGVFKKVEEEILKLGLEKVWEVKPLINGREIMKLLELKNGGPVVCEWQQRLIQWQLAYPCGDVQECIDWMMMQTQLNHFTR